MTFQEQKDLLVLLFECGTGFVAVFGAAAYFLIRQHNKCVHVYLKEKNLGGGPINNENGDTVGYYRVLVCDNCGEPKEFRF